MSIAISGRELRALRNAALPRIQGRRYLRSRASGIDFVDHSHHTTPDPPPYEAQQKEESVSLPDPFDLFSKIPESVRKRIWTTAIPGRIVVLRFDLKSRQFVSEEPNIALLSVSKEAREAAQQIVIPTFNSDGSSRVIYIDVEQDTMFLDPGRDGDPGYLVRQWHDNITPQHFRKIERLDIGLYANRSEHFIGCIKILGETFLLDQARMGMPITQVSLVAHTSGPCNLHRHTAQIYEVGCENHEGVRWETEVTAKVKEVNEAILDAARRYWGKDMDDIYGEGFEGPIRLERRHQFCGRMGVEG